MKIIEIIKLVLVILMVYLPIMTLAVKYINAKIDDWQSQSKLANNSILQKKIDNAQKIVESIVIQVNQVYTDSLKKKNEFTKEAQEEAKNKALDLAATLISTTLKDAVRSVYGDYETWLDVAIESAVNDLK